MEGKIAVDLKVLQFLCLWHISLPVSLHQSHMHTLGSGDITLPTLGRAVYFPKGEQTKIENRKSN
jgi:hypothetical protein